MIALACNPLIDGLQYARWSEKIFREMSDGGVDAVHVTIAYHETFRETVLNVGRWNRWFERFPDLVFQGRTGADVRHARASGRTAMFFGFQNPYSRRSSIMRRLAGLQHAECVSGTNHDTDGIGDGRQSRHRACDRCRAIDTRPSRVHRQP